MDGKKGREGSFLRLSFGAKEEDDLKWEFKKEKGAVGVLISHF
jgi:hypothetical protein